MCWGLVNKYNRWKTLPVNRSGNKIIAYYLWCDGRRDLSNKYCNVEGKRDISLMCLLSFCKNMYQSIFHRSESEKKVCNVNTKKLTSKWWWSYDDDMNGFNDVICVCHHKCIVSVFKAQSQTNKQKTKTHRNWMLFYICKKHAWHMISSPISFFFLAKHTACQHRFIYSLDDDAT